MALILTKFIITIFTLIVFVSSTGSFFKDRYKDNKFLISLSIVIAVISTASTVNYVINKSETEIIKILSAKQNQSDKQKNIDIGLNSQISKESDVSNMSTPLDGKDIMDPFYATLSLLQRAFVKLKPSYRNSFKEKIELSVWVNHNDMSYKSGDKLSIYVKANMDCYLTLFHITNRGEVYVLYPNKFSSGNFIRANKEVLIPREMDNFHLTIQGTKGYDVIKAIVTRKPISVLSKISSNNAGPYKLLTDDMYSFLSKLLATLNNSKENRLWNEKVKIIRIN